MKRLTKTGLGFAMAFLFIIGLPILAFPQSTINVGLIGPMTGPGAMIGRDYRDGSLLCFDKVNAEGGIQGQKINLLIQDDKNQPTVALNVAKKLIYQDKAFAIESMYSPTSLAIMPLTQETGTPHLIGGVAKKILEMGHQWIIRATPSDTILGAHYVTYAVKNLKLKKLAILAENTDYGKGGAADLIDKMKEYGMTPILSESYNHGDKDFAGQLNKIKNSGADGLFIWGLYVEGAQIIRQAKQLGLTMPLLASSGVLQGAFLELAGKDAEGIYCESYFYLGNPAPFFQKFAKEYREKFHYDPEPGAGIGFDHATFLVNALKKVGPDKKKVLQAMRADKFTGVIGRQECDNFGQCGRSALILQIKDGKPALVWSSD